MQRNTFGYFYGKIHIRDIRKPYFSEEEWLDIVKNIVATTTLRSLVQKGLIDSYCDSTTEEIFFLTEKGKEYSKSEELYGVKP